MNIVHLKYAVEVAKTESISKAAENLFMGQPNLSRAIKELEESLGIVIFERTSRGIRVTPDGEEFLRYANRILSQVDEVEAFYQNRRDHKQRFSVCVPRASYISHAFTQFAKQISLNSAAEIFYKETNSMRAIKNVLSGEYNLAIVRYQKVFDEYFKRTFQEKSLSYQLITEFSYRLLISKESPLAKKENILPEDLKDYIEITHADPYVPTLPSIDVKKAELSEFVDKRIYIFERGSQFELLSQVPATFMWASASPEGLLEKYGLTQKDCRISQRLYQDVLIFKKDYRLTELDQKFMAEITKSKEKYL